MKQDIAFVDIDGHPDIDLENGDYISDNGLENAVLISLFTDRFIPSAELPGQGITDRRGWWADSIAEPTGDHIGSRMWQFDVAKIVLSTRNQMKDAVQEALQWMIEDGIASRVTVVTTLIVGTRIDINVTIERPEGDDIPLKFIWDGQELRRA